MALPLKMLNRLNLSNKEPVPPLKSDILSQIPDFIADFESEPDDISETVQLTIQKVNEVQLRGTIKSVQQKNFNDPKSRRDPTNIFTVVTDSNNRSITVRCPFFCPISEGDRIAAFGISDDLNQGYITLRIPPLVLIGTEEVTIVSCLFRALSRCVRAPKERSSKVYSLLN